jgi:pyruvate formate lyase activating enzyme
MSCLRDLRKGLFLNGRQYAPDELARELLKDRLFYDTSGGGVTFSGGEPTLHMDYLGQVARLLKQADVHVAIQTSGLFDLQEFREKVYPNLDLIHFDIKFMDASQHRRFTGVGNERILENFISLKRDNKIDIVPRTPLVPGITADRQNIDAIAKFVKSLGCVRHELLPYNPGGISKRAALGMPAATELPESMMSVQEFGTWMRFIRKSCIGSVT